MPCLADTNIRPPDIGPKLSTFFKTFHRVVRRNRDRSATVAAVSEPLNSRGIRMAACVVRQRNLSRPAVLCQEV